MIAAKLMRPREYRAKVLKKDLARNARVARETAKLTQLQTAEMLDTQQPLVHRWEHQDEPHAPSVLHVASSPSRTWAETLVRWQATHHKLSVYTESAIVHGGNHAARLHALTHSCTDVPRALSEALLDGDISDAELEHIALQARKCIDGTRELEAWTTQELQRRRDERSRR